MFLAHGPRTDSCVIEPVLSNLSKNFDADFLPSVDTYTSYYI
jgi:hypothetical protein